MGSKCIVEFLGRPAPLLVVGDPRNTIPMFHDINSILESEENTINNMDLMKTKKPRKITEEIDPSKHRLPKCHGTIRKIRKIPVGTPHDMHNETWSGSMPDTCRSGRSSLWPLPGPEDGTFIELSIDELVVDIGGDNSRIFYDLCPLLPGW